VINWLSSSRLIIYGLITLILFPFQIVGLVICYPLTRIIPLLHHKLTAKVIGLKINPVGTPSTKTGVLFVSNHLSYFDIIAIGSLIPGRFIAKSDVARWPVFGLLAKITRTIFIDRKQKSSAHHQIRSIQIQLEKLENLILFPEGTSSDGRRVLPFKTSLFAAPTLTNTSVQPITIRYTHVNGIPIQYSMRHFFSWYGNMELAPHLWTALSLGTLDIEVVFHEPLNTNQFTDRKKLAEYCYEIIAKGI
jgi:1-acyl-sn-glycerol-3-phosphate acyltransferase